MPAVAGKKMERKCKKEDGRGSLKKKMERKCKRLKYSACWLKDNCIRAISSVLCMIVNISDAMASQSLMNV